MLQKFSSQTGRCALGSVWVACVFFLIFCERIMAKLPDGFVYLHDSAPTILSDVVYYRSDNFIGRKVKGYERPVCILTREAAEAVSKVQKLLADQGLGLKVFDCYRPQTAVKDFKAWSLDVADQKTKADYFPRVNKADFFELGYVVEKSSHSRGSTIDLTLIKPHADGSSEELFMGTRFDFMDELSHAYSDKVSPEAQKNRELLRHAMEKGGFQAYEPEWWHFTLQNEPFPNTYFDFPVG